MKELFIQETTVNLASGAVGVQDYVAVAGQIFFFLRTAKLVGVVRQTQRGKPSPAGSSYMFLLDVVLI